MTQQESQKDTVYAAPLTSISAFQFDSAVADVFQDMIERSVPGYGLVLQLIGVLAERYTTPNTNVYDLGCSLGASTLQLRRHVPANCHVIGVDNSQAMVERCEANLSRDHSAATYEIALQDLRDTSFDNASMIVLNFTLQFIDDSERQSIIDRIYAGLTQGGILLLAEKVRYDNPEKQQLMTDIHHHFKRQQGYSDLEISQKRAALENVLVPNTEQEHLNRLKQAGFNRQETCIQCINFSTFIGIKA
jgi:tRNA (cmo5U34)-methyltransferase